jgi:hypothetical protein
MPVYSEGVLLMDNSGEWIKWVIFFGVIGLLCFGLIENLMN